MTTKVFKIKFENNDFDHVRNIENVGDTSFMKEGTLYPTQFSDMANSKWAYVSKTQLYKNGNVVDGLSFHYIGHLNIAGKEISTEEIQIQIQNELEDVWCHTEDGIKIKSLFKDSYVDKQGLFHKRVDMEGIITLDNGKFLIRDFDKYRSGLCFVSSIPVIPFTEVSPSDLNLPKGCLKAVYGFFYLSKKGTKCFKCSSKEQATHMLLQDNWGGPFNSYRGNTLPGVESGALYYHRASSNGGGSGYDYAVVPSNWNYSLSEDEI